MARRIFFFFFFFQAEDGIRDVAVTGVQTCALPILYVVDGVIYSDASISTGLFSVTASGNPQSTRNDGEKQDDPVNRLTDLNPNDVASIEILRGAAASSIYGSKGVNGVVIITTNRGKAGKPRANIIQRV